VRLCQRRQRQVRAHQRLARGLERLAGVFLVGFGIRLGTQ
jgi:threonine/homoserine/homoserine lactone efflux protein